MLDQNPKEVKIGSPDQGGWITKDKNAIGNGKICNMHLMLELQHGQVNGHIFYVLSG